MTIRTGSSASQTIEVDRPVPIVRIELDEKAVAFPAATLVSHLLVREGDPACVDVEGVFVFNRACASPRLLHLKFDELDELCECLVHTVYSAKASIVLNDEVKIFLQPVANGYHIDYKRAGSRTELLLSTSCIWRVVKGLLFARDLLRRDPRN